MKTSFKVITSIFALGAVILLALHLTLLYGLTRAMREVVLPRIKAETGIDAQVGRLSINLAAGELYLNQVEVRNPAGFLLENLASVDRVEVSVDIPSLFKQKLIRVKNVDVENALVNVIRNKDGALNLQRLQQTLPQPDRPATGTRPQSEPPVERRADRPAPLPKEDQPPLPELIIETLQCNASVRYIDFKLNELDIALDLVVSGESISTLSDPKATWGNITVQGALGNNRTSFNTDLKVRLAPLRNPKTPSFDLTGRILEIDPQLMDDIYESLKIRSAPFGLKPDLQCRAGWFVDSRIGLELTDIELEEGLADDLGGLSSIDALRFSVPVEGALLDPRVDIRGGLLSAMRGNMRSLFDAFLRGVIGKETGDSTAAKKVLKDLAGGSSGDTNAPSGINTDTLIDLLGEQVEEIGENEAVKEELKNIGKWLLGE